MREKTGKRKTRACATCPISAVCFVEVPRQALKDVFHCDQCGAWWTVKNHDGVRGTLEAQPWEPCDVLVRVHARSGWHMDRCPGCVPPENRSYAGEVVYEVWKELPDGDPRSPLRKGMRLRVRNGR